MGAKITLASTLIAVGAALITGGPTVFVTAAALAWQYLHLLLFGLSALIVVVATVPRRVLLIAAVPGLLGSGLWFARSYGLAPVGRFGGGACLLALGIMLAMRPDRERDVNLRRRRWSVLINRRLNPRQAPARIRLVAMCRGRITVNLARATNENELVQLFLSSWFGRIDLRFPPTWLVVAGRVTAARGVRFEGRLDSDRGYEYPDDHDVNEELRAAVKDSARRRDCVAVVHVLGIGGGVTIQRGRR